MAIVPVIIWPANGSDPLPISEEKLSLDQAAKNMLAVVTALKAVQASTLRK